MSAPERPGGAAPLGLAYAACPVLLAAYVYYPVTRNYFHGDDFLNLYEIANGDLAPFLLRMHGGHLLMSRNSVFALLFRLFGADPAPYQWLAFLTHLANVALLGALVRRLTGSLAAACFGAALWGTLPTNEGSLGWYSVYGQVMATTCLLAVLHVLLGAGPERARIVTALLLLAVAATSFGVGLGVVMAMPAAAFFLLAPGAERRRVVGALAVLAALTPLAYFAVQRLSITVSGQSAAMGFQLAAQRYYMNSVRLFLELSIYGMSCLVFGVVHRAAPVGPAFVAGLSAAAAAAVLPFAERRARARVLSFLLLAAGAYAVIAAGRGMIGRGARTALMASSSRFHYLAAAMLAVSACVLLAELGRRAGLARFGRAAVPVWMGAVLALHAWRGPVLPSYAYCRRETAAVLAAVRSAVAAARPGEDVYIDNHEFRCLGPLLSASLRRFPGWAGVFAVSFATNVVDGRRVHFLESDPAAVENAARGRRTAGLVLAYEDVGRKPPAPKVRSGSGGVAPSVPERGSP